jgi:hypothetical protein
MVMVMVMGKDRGHDDGMVYVCIIIDSYMPHIF